MLNVNNAAANAESSQNKAAYVNDTRQAQSVKESSKTENKQTAGNGSSAPKKDEVQAAVNNLNNALDSINVRREFKIEDTTKDLVVKIIDRDQQKVIRQIPSEEAVKLSKNIQEMIGLMYDSTS